MEIETVVERLKCTLTQQEMADVAVTLGKLQQDLDGLKTTRKVLVQAIADKSQIATNGWEMRTVSCRWEPDYPNRVMRLIRQDTFSEVRSRMMTHEELQQRISFEP